MRLPLGDLRSQHNITLIPRSVAPSTQGQQHPRALDTRASLFTGFEPGTSSSGVRCMMAELCNLFYDTHIHPDDPAGYCPPTSPRKCLENDAPPKLFIVRPSTQHRQQAHRQGTDWVQPN